MMKKLSFLFLVLALGAGLAASAPAAELVKVAEATGVVTVLGAPSDDALPPAGDGGVSGPGPAPKIKIKIHQVVNLRGNNPFNPIQPVYNSGGQTFDNAAELAQATSGGSGASPSSPSGPGSGSGAGAVGPSTRTSPPNDGVIFYFNPDSNRYFLGDSGAAPPAGFQEAFDNWTPGGAPGQIAVQTNPGGDFRITAPPAGAAVRTPGISWLVSPGRHTMTIQEQSTGRQWQVDFTNARSGDDRITLTIHSVNRL